MYRNLYPSQNVSPSPISEPPTHYVVEITPYGSVGRPVKAVPNDGWVPVQKKKNSRGIYFLVDRNSQPEISNPPGGVTGESKKMGKVKHVTFAPVDSPDPGMLPPVLTPPSSSSLSKTKTRGQGGKNVLPGDPCTPSTRVIAAPHPPPSSPSPSPVDSRNGPAEGEAEAGNGPLCPKAPQEGAQKQPRQAQPHASRGKQAWAPGSKGVKSNLLVGTPKLDAPISGIQASERENFLFHTRTHKAKKKKKKMEESV